MHAVLLLHKTTCNQDFSIVKIESMSLFTSEHAAYEVSMHQFKMWLLLAFSTKISPTIAKIKLNNHANLF